MVARRVAGEVPQSLHDSLVEEIESELGLAGRVSSAGNALTWKPRARGGEASRLEVKIEVIGGRTRIQVEDRLELGGWKSVAPIWGAGGGGLFGLLLALAQNTPEPFVIIPGLVFAFWGGLLTAEGILGSDARKKLPQLKKLAERLAELVRQGSSTVLPPGVEGGRRVPSRE
jgi:hypothetical protein